MILTAFDLEMNQPSGKIIQLGYCFGDLSSGAILKSASCLVECGETIVPHIEKLTGITNDQMVDAVWLEAAFRQYCGDIAAFQPFMNPLTWGCGDVPVLRAQLGALGKSDLWPFGRRYDDVKTLARAYQLANGQPTQGGLAKTCNRLGIQFEGKKHNAEADACMTFKVYHKLLQEMKK